MSKKTSNLLLLGFFIGFFIIGGLSLKNSMPQDKDKRLYPILQHFMPYKLEKKIGGFKIITKKTGEKEEPPVAEVMKRLDELEIQWGKNHLKLEGSILIVLDDDAKIIKKIPLNTQDEVNWIHNFYGIK